MADGVKPERCTHPDCFSCPYEDCMWDQIAIDEYKQSVNLDKEAERITEYKQRITEYKQRSFDCTGRKEYFRNYYQKNRERKIESSRRNRKVTGWKDTRDRRDYYRQYYIEHRDQKIERNKERNKIVREAINATR